MAGQPALHRDGSRLGLRHDVGGVAVSSFDDWLRPFEPLVRGDESALDFMRFRHWCGDTVEWAWLALGMARHNEAAHPHYFGAT